MPTKKLFGDIDGKLVPASHLTVHVTDLSFIRGYGVFDLLITHNCVPFLLRDHLARLRNSARITGLRVPVSDKELTRRVKKVMLKNNLKRSAVYILLTGGESSNMLSYEKPRLMIYEKEAHAYPARLFKKGACIITHPYTREFPEAKVMNYLTRVSLQKTLARARASEVLYTTGNLVTECSTSNIFMIKGKKLVTPSNLILEGITRKFVLSLAKKLPLKVEKRDVRLTELLRADEVFITSTVRDIMPVVKINKTKIGKGVPGPYTKELMKRFEESVRAAK